MEMQEVIERLLSQGAFVHFSLCDGEYLIEVSDGENMPYAVIARPTLEEAVLELDGVVLHK